MFAIIQESLKKINRQINNTAIISLTITTILLIIFTFYIQNKEGEKLQEVNYIKTNKINKQTEITVSDIFASINGKTYTYSWCNGAGKIKKENKVFFNTEEEAKATGRTLSKLCK